MEIVKLIIFSFVLNWCISLQILNQTLQNGRQKVVAVLLALVTGCFAGLILML